MITGSEIVVSTRGFSDIHDLTADEVAEGEVVRTDPPAGESLAEGEVLTVWFSLGPTTVPLAEMAFAPLS